MLQRYVIPCAIVVVLAASIAVSAYLLTPVNFSGTCTFTFALPSTSSPVSTDAISFQNERAANEVAQVERGDIFSGPATTLNVDPAQLASEIAVSQIPGSSNFALVASDTNGSRAATFANAMCDQLVQRLTAQVQQERDAEVTALHSKISILLQSIATIQTTPASARTAEDNSFLAAQQQAVNADQTLLATALALPADNIAVVTRAPGGVRNDTRSFTRNVLVAGVAALLACFLVILIGEVAREQASPQ